MLGTFLVFGRAWSRRGGLLAALAVAPFVALLVLQAVGAPRNPPFALEWVATAVPMLAIGVGRAVSLAGRWPRVRAVGLGLAALLAVAAVDQAARVHPTERYDVAPLVARVAEVAGPDDVVVHAPEVLGDLLRHEVHAGEVVAVDATSARRLSTADEVVVIGAFGFGDDAALASTLDLVEQLAADRPLLDEVESDDAKVWVFG